MLTQPAAHGFQIIGVVLGFMVGPGLMYGSALQDEFSGWGLFWFLLGWWMVVKGSREVRARIRDRQVKAAALSAVAGLDRRG